MKRVLPGVGLAALTLLAANSAFADVKPNGLFSNGCVLQRDMKIPVFGTGDEGETVTVTLNGKSATATVQGGKWLARLPALKAGGPYVLTIKGKNTMTVQDVLIGEVWICSGQSNMEFNLGNAAEAKDALPASTDPQLRMFNVPYVVAKTPLKDVGGQWQVSGPNTAGGFSAVGYFFARDLRKSLGVPVGMINSCWGGTPAEAWTSRDTLAANSVLQPLLEEQDRRDSAYNTAQGVYDAEQSAARKVGRTPDPTIKPAKDPFDQNSPASLYNGKIAPLIPYALRGAIWYQGESNAGRAYQYQTLFPAMITNWRADWGEGAFPFFFVQLAPWQAIVGEPTESEWAELREAQRLTSINLPGTAMAVITDWGDEKDIHPRHKEPVGDRLALAARALVYKQRLEYYGPTFSKQTIKGSQIVVAFKHTTGGLKTQDGQPLKGFTIAGADKKWVNAAAVIQGDTVVVSSPQVAIPTAVRYGWANFPVVNLTNGTGIPATPFRTDDFPLITKR